MKLDDVFVKKDDIAIAVKTELNEAMMDYGYLDEAKKYFKKALSIEPKYSLT